MKKRYSNPLVLVFLLTYFPIHVYAQNVLIMYPSASGLHLVGVREMPDGGFVGGGTLRTLGEQYPALAFFDANLDLLRVEYFQTGPEPYWGVALQYLTEKFDMNDKGAYVLTGQAVVSGADDTYRFVLFSNMRKSYIRLYLVRTNVLLSSSLIVSPEKVIVLVPSIDDEYGPYFISLRPHQQPSVSRIISPHIPLYGYTSTQLVTKSHQSFTHAQITQMNVSQIYMRLFTLYPQAKRVRFDDLTIKAGHALNNLVHSNFTVQPHDESSYVIVSAVYQNLRKHGFTYFMINKEEEKVSGATLLFQNGVGFHVNFLGNLMNSGLFLMGTTSSGLEPAYIVFLRTGRDFRPSFLSFYPVGNDPVFYEMFPMKNSEFYLNTGSFEPGYRKTLELYEGTFPFVLISNFKPSRNMFCPNYFGQRLNIILRPSYESIEYTGHVSSSFEMQLMTEQTGIKIAERAPVRKQMFVSGEKSICFFTLPDSGKRPPER